MAEKNYGFGYSVRAGKLFASNDKGETFTSISSVGKDGKQSYSLSILEEIKSTTEKDDKGYPKVVEKRYHKFIYRATTTEIEQLKAKLLRNEQSVSVFVNYAVEEYKDGDVWKKSVKAISIMRMDDTYQLVQALNAALFIAKCVLPKDDTNITMIEQLRDNAKSASPKQEAAKSEPTITANDSDYPSDLPF